MIEYTREELIQLCKEGERSYDKWMDRDSHSAQSGLHIAKLCLEGGCKFRILRDKNDSCCTNEDLVWVEIFYDDWEDGEDWHSHYIPTKKRLEECKDMDWY